MHKIVQFTHPGAEHGPDKGKKTHKSWNTGKHKRKFLNAYGKYVQGDTLKEGNLLFWGEWEPPSEIIKLDNQGNKLMPKWLHKPYLPATLPKSTGYQQSYQNTDPLVFGEHFRYFVCKQFKPKSGKETALAKLERGSIILFGSTKNANTKDAFFQLDTVFVVSDYIEYDPSDENALSNYNIDGYRDFVFKMAFPEPFKHSLKLRLYIGATYDNPVSGMYSFAPARLYENNKHGFPRVKLKDLKYLTNNLNAGPKITDVEEKDVIEFWKKIRNISRDEGCVEGVQFYIERR